jgi:beta-mannosidase
LNDIWPVTSWASIDYCGRYKALQYVAKRFYAPVLLSCEEIGELQNRRYVNIEAGNYNSEKSVRFCVTNDTLTDIAGIVKWERRDESSNISDCGEISVCVPKMSSVWLDKMVLDSFDVEHEHIFFSLSVEDAVISEGSVLLAAPKHYSFSDPQLEWERIGDIIKIRSNAYAKAVMLEGVDGDVIFEDNCFDMEKGEKNIRILSGDAESFVIRSVYDIG